MSSAKMLREVVRLDGGWLDSEAAGNGEGQTSRKCCHRGERLTLVSVGNTIKIINLWDFQ